MAAHLGAMAIFKEASPSSPSLAADDFVEIENLEAQPLSPESVNLPIPSLRVFDNGTEARLRGIRAEREKWLEETCMNFVQCGLDAGMCIVQRQ